MRPLRLVCPLAFASLALPAHAATVNNFDLPGAGYAILQLDQPPPPTLVSGPTGQQMRLAAGAGALPVHNTLAFERTDPAHPPFYTLCPRFERTHERSTLMRIVESLAERDFRTSSFAGRL